MNSPIINTKQAAELLQVSVPTLRNLIIDEGLPAFKLGDEYRLVFDQVVSWCEQRAVIEQCRFAELKAERAQVLPEPLPRKRGRPRQVVDLARYN